MLQISYKSIVQCIYVKKHEKWRVECWCMGCLVLPVRLSREKERIGIHRKYISIMCTMHGLFGLTGGLHVTPWYLLNKLKKDNPSNAWPYPMCCTSIIHSVRAIQGLSAFMPSFQIEIEKIIPITLVVMYSYDWPRVTSCIYTLIGWFINYDTCYVWLLVNCGILCKIVFISGYLKLFLCQYN